MSAIAIVLLCFSLVILILSAIQFDQIKLPLAAHPTRILLEYATISGIIALAVYLVLPVLWSRLLLVILCLIFLAVGSDVISFASAVYTVGSIYLAGSFVLRKTRVHRRLQIPELRWICGTILFLVFTGVLAHTHLNYRSGYVIALALPYLFSLSRVSELNAAGSRVAASIRMLPYIQFIFFILVFTYVASCAFFPTINFDDNSLHRLIGSELRFYRQVQFNFSSQKWAVAPFAVDLIHGCVTFVAGRDARGATNIMLLALSSWMVWRLLRLVRVPRGPRLLLSAVTISSPIVLMLVTSQQVELFAICLAAATGSLILRLRRAPWSDVLIAAVGVCALALACKITMVILLGALFVPYVMLRTDWKANFFDVRPNAKWVIALGVSAIFVAFHSYIFSYIKTGNPVFPLYNGIFKSPFLPLENYVDGRYANRRTLVDFFRMFWWTSNFFESRDGVSGFQFVFEVPVAIVLAAFDKRRRTLFLMFLAAVLYCVVMFYAIQYYRYMAPAIPLSTAILAALFSSEKSSDTLIVRLRYISATLLLGTVAIFNLIASPNAAWYMADGWLQLFSRGKKHSFLVENNPELILNEKLSLSGDGKEKILFDPDHPVFSTLWGSVYSQSSYMPILADRMAATKSPLELTDLLRRLGVTTIYWDLSRIYEDSGSYTAKLGPIVSEYGFPVMQVGQTIAYKFMPSPIKRKLITDFYPPTLSEFNRGVRVPQSKAGLMVSSKNSAVANVSVGNAKWVTYKVDFQCASHNEIFVAQVNWQDASPYYRLVQCTGREQNFTENVLVRNTTGLADVYLSTRGSEGALVKRVRMYEIEEAQ
ncbi:MAG: hypothetical protein EPN59_02975 [Paraburkholderia sp.]|uniref:hypothetical protein n=2 Tax=Paraburkholderia sp. TaxID=1926495 RepID=UPI0012023287|nr:hypothetical protein [Paraburkholderia sp.]TAM31922.1 MAG: hypothetical protein EPN59_02975 [Paraburkholderia sp.]